MRVTKNFYGYFFVSLLNAFSLLMAEVWGSQHLVQGSLRIGDNLFQIVFELSVRDATTAVVLIG